MIGFAEELIFSSAIHWKGCHPAADEYSLDGLLVPCNKLSLAELLSDFFHLEKRLFPFFTWEHDYKFISAVSPNQCIGSSMCLDNFRHCHQHLVSCDMPKLLID